ncbi:MAG: hypothetical protein DMD82_00105 [Candidatus Rokuibacteriota bacterium]|nr:MAG: hypothetical protein DMD82_00105 [Candidatus Rokubacteria bacterium]
MPRACFASVDASSAAMVADSAIARISAIWDARSESGVFAWLPATAPVSDRAMSVAAPQRTERDRVRRTGALVP